VGTQVRAVGGAATLMPAFLVPLHESNDCHTPAGSSAGGEFCSGPGAMGKTLSADDVGALLEQQHEHVEARKQEQEFGALANTTRHEKDYLQDKFVVSKTFTLMDIDVESAAPMGVVRGALSHSRGPIVVDKNKGSFGRGMYGAPPMVVVLDGKHRLAEAKARGEKTITAYVGEEALPHVLAKGVPASRKVTDSWGGVRAKSKKHLEETVTSYGLILKKATRAEDGSWDVTVSGGRDEIDHFNRDTEG
jgi:hypothetical protein